MQKWGRSGHGFWETTEYQALGMCVHMFKCACVHAHVYISICVHPCVCAGMYMCAHMCIQAVCVCDTCVCVCILARRQQWVFILNLQRPGSLSSRQHSSVPYLCFTTLGKWDETLEMIFKWSFPLTFLIINCIVYIWSLSFTFQKKNKNYHALKVMGGLGIGWERTIKI